MNSSKHLRASVAAILITAASGCGASRGGPVILPPPEYTALPDTLVCVVDRSSPDGLTELPGKVNGGSVLLFSGGAVRPLEELHPINLIAGYAGQEEWLGRSDPIFFSNGTYRRVGGDRRVGMDLLGRVGEHMGILLFAGRDDPAPVDALYVPTSPGCIFQAYVREDLIEP
jgi:hypothetical protein